MPCDRHRTCSPTTAFPTVRNGVCERRTLFPDSAGAERRNLAGGSENPEGCRRLFFQDIRKRANGAGFAAWNVGSPMYLVGFSMYYVERRKYDIVPAKSVAGTPQCLRGSREKGKAARKCGFPGTKIRKHAPKNRFPFTESHPAKLHMPTVFCLRHQVAWSRLSANSRRAARAGFPVSVFGNSATQKMWRGISCRDKRLRKPSRRPSGTASPSQSSTSA